jgi:hypothetical protein
MSFMVDIVKTRWVPDAATQSGEITLLCPFEDGPMEEVSELTEALDLLLRGVASEAVRIASRHGKLPLAKCLLFLAYDFFFLESSKAAEVFGGVDGLREILAPDRLEGYFLEGYHALFSREYDAALQEFAAAVGTAPEDPFILFGIAVAQLRKDNPTAAAMAIVEIEEVAPLHPLVGLFRKMLRNRSDY